MEKLSKSRTWKKKQQTIGLAINGSRGLSVLRKLESFTEFCISWVLVPEDFLSSSKTSNRIIDTDIFIGVRSAKHLDDLESQISNVDFLVCAGFPLKIPKSILMKATKIGINCHGGPLPKYRGGSPIIWQILNDEDLINFTIHELTSEFDSGDVILESNLPNNRNLYIHEIQEKVNYEFSKLLEVFFADPERYIAEKRAQQDSEAKYWHQRRDSDGFIDWKCMTASQVYNFVRAISRPYPGSYNFLSEGEIVRIWKVDIDSVPICGIPGRVVVMSDGVHVVAMNDSSVKLTDYNCGRRIRNGEFLFKDWIRNR